MIQAIDASKTGLRPDISDIRPYRGWNAVVPRRKAVPAQVIVVPAEREFEIVGRAVVVAFISRYDIK